MVNKDENKDFYIKLIWCKFYSSFTYTDGWEEKYSSDYQYASELVDKLISKGKSSVKKPKRSIE